MDPRTPRAEAVPPPLGGLDSAARRPAAGVSESRLLRAIDELEGQLREVSDIYRAVRLAQRAAAGLMGADDACVALLAPGREDAVLLQPVQSRAEVLAALEAVDLVAIFDEDTPAELIRHVKPTVLVKGSDYTREEVVGREFVESLGGEVVLIDIVPGHSTTSMVERSRVSKARSFR